VWEKITRSISGRASNAASPVGAATIVSYDPRYDQSARTVAAAIPGSKLVAEKGLGRTIHVTVGTSYTGAQKVKVSSGTASASPTATKARTAADDTCT